MCISWRIGPSQSVGDLTLNGIQRASRLRKIFIQFQKNSRPPASIAGSNPRTIRLTRAKIWPVAMRLIKLYIFARKDPTFLAIR
jgi:hypothetical protein